MGLSRGSVCKWTAEQWPGCPHSKLLALGELGRKEGPGAPPGDLRKKVYGLLHAKPLHRAGKYNM